MPKSKSTVLSLVAFIASCMFFAFLFGMAVGRYQFFPFGFFRDAKVAFDQVFGSSGVKPHHLYPVRYERAGARRVNDAATAPGVTLLTSYWRDLDWKPGVRLIDLDGRVLHTWRVDPAEIWPESPHSDHMAGRLNTAANYVHGAYLFDDGDLLVSVEYMGLARLNAKGEVVWRLPRRTHHSVTRAEDGTFWVCAMRWLEDGDERLARFPGLRPPLDEDFALNVSPDGEILREVSILEALYESGNHRLIWKIANRKSGDVLHMNDVEPLPEALADAYPLFDAGDVAISLRFPHTVFVMSPETGRVKWVATDPFIQQHDPDFVGDGWIHVFDNNTDGTHTGKWLGGSRIVAVRPHTGESRVIYPTGESEAFYTAGGGKMQTLPNGNILITEARAGRVFEVDAEGRTVWDWVQEPYEDEDWVPEVLEGTRYLLTPEQIASWDDD
jgi:hypothetical protein